MRCFGDGGESKRYCTTLARVYSRGILKEMNKSRYAWMRGYKTLKMHRNMREKGLFFMKIRLILLSGYRISLFSA